MAYIDGLVIPVPSGNRDTYLALAKKAARVFLEHGATRVVEAWGDDIKPGKPTTSAPQSSPKRARA